MADNVTFQSGTPATPPADLKVAADEVPYSGDTAQVQIVQLAGVTGSEGSRAIEKVDATSANGLKVDVSRLPNEGQQTMANSVSVAVASDQSAVPVSASSLPLPSGAATSALQTTLIGHVDGVEAVLASIDGKIPASPATAGNQATGNASLASIDGKVPALGQALNAASVPVVLTASQLSTLTPPAAITGFLSEADFDSKTGALTESAPATDTASSGLNGRLQRIAQRITSLIALIPAALTAGGGMKAGLVDSIPAGTNNIGDVDVLSLPAIPAGTNAIGKLAANSGIDIGDVDVTSVLPGSGATNLGKAVDSALGATDTGVMVLAVRDDTTATLTEADGDFTPLRTNSRGALHVNLESRLDSTQDSISSVGSVAHDAVDSGNPVKVGHKAIALGANPTAVAAADRTDWYANRHGIPFFIGGHPNILTKNLNVTDADGAQTDTALVTVSSGSKIVVTHITVTADNANTTDVQVRIGFGTTNTPAADAAGVILAHAGIPSGGGVSLGNGAGIIGAGADGEDLRVTCEDPVGGAIDIVVGYFTIES